MIYENTCLKFSQKDIYEYLFEFKNVKYKLFYKTFIKNYDNDEYLNIKAEEINTLEHLVYKEKFNYKLCELLYAFLIKQLGMLYDQNYTILQFSMKDILYFKINGNYAFYYVNAEDIFHLEDDVIIIDKMIYKKPFIAPELKKIDELPFKANITASYWSLAKVIKECLNKINVSMTEINDFDLFVFLKNNLNKEVENRNYIFEK